MPSKLYHNVRPRKQKKKNDAPRDGKPGSVINASTRKENYLLATGKIIPRALCGGNYFSGIELNSHVTLARELVFIEIYIESECRLNVIN